MICYSDNDDEAGDSNLSATFDALVLYECDGLKQAQYNSARSSSFSDISRTTSRVSRCWNPL